MPVDAHDDEARRRAAEQGHLATAIAALMADAFGALPFEAMAPTKGLVKRYFSPQPWTPADDEALADLLGPGEGRWSTSLGDDLTFSYGWDDAGRFGMAVAPVGAAGGEREPDEAPAAGPEVAAGAVPAEPTSRAGEAPPIARPDEALVATFDGDVVPEATPSARTIRFATGPVHDGPSRWYPSADEVDDPRVAGLFADFPEVRTVLVGADFVAVGLQRPEQWERRLVPILGAVTQRFAGGGPGVAVGSTPPPWVVAAEAAAAGGRPASAPPSPAGAGGAGRRPGTLDAAWAELGRLRPEDPEDLARLLGAAGDDDPGRRQVAAALLGDAPPEAAAAAWAGLVADPQRSVRRAAVDAVGDAGREELRPLLEAAAADADGWTRWRALRGLAELGPGPSERVLRTASGDRDLRVRLEALAALHAAG